MKRNRIPLSAFVAVGLMLLGCPSPQKGESIYDLPLRIMPNNVTAKANSTTSITVSWNDVEGAIGYHVYRRSDTSYTYTHIDSTDSTSYTDTGLSENTLYTYQISAYNNLYVSPRSANASERTHQPPPKPPYRKYISVVANNITLSWSNALQYEDGYKIYRSLSDSGGYTEIGFIDKDESPLTYLYRDNGLSENTTYYYKITSYHKIYGESPLSTTDFISATTQSRNTGQSWETAIEIISSGFGDSGIGTWGDFPEDWDMIWYKFTRNGSGTIFAKDRAYSYSTYSGDIVVDVLLMYENELYYVTLDNNKRLENINIGGGYGDYENIRVSNWDGTFYVLVQPRLKADVYKGTFELFFN